MSATEAAAAELELALRARLRIDPFALDEEFQACPADIAYLGAVHARMIGEQLRAKSRAKRLRALVYIQKRDELAEAGVKVTERQVEAAVEQDQRVVDADEEEILAEVALATAKANFAAVAAKRDMLIQLGATARKEMERDPVVMRERREVRARDGGT